MNQADELDIQLISICVFNEKMRSKVDEVVEAHSLPSFQKELDSLYDYETIIKCFETGLATTLSDRLKRFAIQEVKQEAINYFIQSKQRIKAYQII